MNIGTTVTAEGSCPSIPVTFRNTSPNPDGLQVRQSYAAEPLDSR